MNDLQTFGFISTVALLFYGSGILLMLWQIRCEIKFLQEIVMRYGDYFVEDDEEPKEGE